MIREIFRQFRNSILHRVSISTLTIFFARKKNQRSFYITLLVKAERFPGITSQAYCHHSHHTTYKILIIVVIFIIATMFQCMSGLARFLINLNLFKSGLNDELILMRERQSTRLFLFVFIIASITLTTYTSLNTETVQVTLIKPLLSTYKHLYKTYSNTVKCFCSRTAVKYENFMHIDIEYHEVYFIYEVLFQVMWVVFIHRFVQVRSFKINGSSIHIDTIVQSCGQWMFAP